MVAATTWVITMAKVAVVEQNAQQIVLEFTVDGLPELTERVTVMVDLIAQDPGILAQVRDEFVTKLEQKQAAWITAQSALSSL